MGLFALLILGAIGFPFPEGTVLIAGGFLISTSVLKFIVVLIIAYSGVLMGDMLAYFIGKKYGRAIVTHKGFHWIISPERLSKLENKVNKRGGLPAIISGHLVGEMFIVVGIMRIPFVKFLVTDAIVSAFTIAIWLGLGYVGGDSLEILRRDMTRIEHLVILAAVILLSIYLTFRYFKANGNKKAGEPVQNF